MTITNADTFLFASNAVFIDEMYARYAKDPSSVSDDWVQFFKQNQNTTLKTTASVIGNKNEFTSIPANEITITKDDVKSQKSVAQITNDSVQSVSANKTLLSSYIEDLYIKYGHIAASLDPLGFVRNSESLFISLAKQKYQNIQSIFILNGSDVSGIEFFNAMDNLYSSNIGVEFSHIESLEERQWLGGVFCSTMMQNIPSQTQKDILEGLTQAEMFEHHIHLKFPGAKRFSIEGCEALIPALKTLLATSSQNGTIESVIGMAHRGRLNVLTNIMGKPYEAVFAEFGGVDFLPPKADKLLPDISGDVKYHMGYSNDISYVGGKKMHLTLTPNPSHLESVNPVVMGRTRAKQDALGDVSSRSSVLPVIIHGDAAMSGQGVVYETFAMANLAGYRVGGTIHISIDNQVGFTASTNDTRCVRYSTEVAKVINAPVFHVNTSDIESVVRVAKIVAEYRTKFGKDVVLDLVSYRKYGHNEGDEPMFTQPVMYEKIKTMPNPHESYAKALISANVIDEAHYTNLKTSIKQKLDEAFERSKTYKQAKIDWLEGKWSHIKPVKSADDILLFNATTIAESDFKALGKAISTIADSSFVANKKILKIFDDRLKTITAGSGLDWASAELLAYASLVKEGKNIRISGEDCERGTFSHRHSVIYDQNTNLPYNIFSSINGEKSGKYEVYNSLLSEFGVLGYEYGYSFSSPDTLTIWEAQFGDFSNGAVTIYDQFISSGEDKWSRMNSVVSLLPHGFEGQGPEHSSARLERYLQYCAKNNIIVANPSVPANLFHLLRRQVLAPFRKPLIITTPKSLLRHPMVVSDMQDFTKTGFRSIITNSTAKSPDNVTKVIIVSGKFYYDIMQQVIEQNIPNCAIVRLEQYYPFDSAKLTAELSKFTNTKRVIWAQEEPKNMGAWAFVRDYIDEVLVAVKLKTKISSVEVFARPASASPATGYYKVHNKEQDKLIEEILG